MIEQQLAIKRAIYRSETKWTVQKGSMEDEKIDEEEVWSAIRYLDPDEREKDRETNTATAIAILAILFIVSGVWVLFWLRVRQP